MTNEVSHWNETQYLCSYILGDPLLVSPWSGLLVFVEDETGEVCPALGISTQRLSRPPATIANAAGGMACDGRGMYVG